MTVDHPLDFHLDGDEATATERALGQRVQCVRRRPAPRRRR